MGNSIKQIYSYLIYNNYDYKKYKLLINKICNYKILNIDDYIFINTLPKDKIINIIKIYNLQTENINYYFSK